MLDTREELLLALQEAAELEHGLMVQYLYAALTLKTAAGDGLTTDQLVMVRAWRRTLSTIARQEMGHLGTVQNFLSTLGGGPHFSIPRFPMPAKYYHPSQVFSLEPLTPGCIDRFVHFEAPIGQPVVNVFGLQPDPLRYVTVGDLYRQISDAITAANQADLFIGPSNGQDLTHWGSVAVLPTRTLVEAGKAVDHIIEEGEATTIAGADSHYQKFVKIRDQYQQALLADPAFVPYRNVVSNPTTIVGRVDGSTYLANDGARRVGELFAASYQTLLMTLSQYYKFQESIDVPVVGIDPGQVLQSVAVGLMQVAIRAVGEDILPTLQAAAGDKMAGPCFETYSSLATPWSRSVFWKVLVERLNALKEEALNLSADHPILADVSQGLGELIDQAKPMIG